MTICFLFGTIKIDHFLKKRRDNMNIEQIKAAVADTPYDFLREDPGLAKISFCLPLAEAMHTVWKKKTVTWIFEGLR